MMPVIIALGNRRIRAILQVGDNVQTALERDGPGAEAVDRAWGSSDGLSLGLSIQRSRMDQPMIINDKKMFSVVG